MTFAQRQATKRYRERHRKRGLKRIEVQIPPDAVAAIRKAAAILRGEPEEAARLREHLGLKAEPERMLSVLDVFAMADSLSAEGEALWDEAIAQIERDGRNPALNRARDIDL